MSFPFVAVLNPHSPRRRIAANGMGLVVSIPPLPTKGSLTPRQKPNRVNRSGLRRSELPGKNRIVLSSGLRRSKVPCVSHESLPTEKASL